MAPTIGFDTPPAGPDPRVEIERRHAALAVQSHYEILGVEPGADRDAVRAAYRRLARRFHPDAGRRMPPSIASQSQDIFIRATEAYEALMGSRSGWAKPHRRREPTEEAAAPRRPEGSPSPPPEHPPARRVPRRPRPSAAGSPPAGEDRRAAAPAVADVLRDAKARLLRGNAEGAVSLLHEVVAGAEGEDRRRVLRLLSRAYVEVPRWRRYAVSQLRGLLEERPGDAEAQALLGVVYHREGLLSRAEAALTYALQLDPGQPDARRELRLVQKERDEKTATRRPDDSQRPGLLTRLRALAS